MGMQLNIKSEEAYRMASRLAEMTGESMTAVVTEALRAELRRREMGEDRAVKLERLLGLARELRAGLREPITSDTSDMYDENGLPI
jgi:antitoxin VapB